MDDVCLIRSMTSDNNEHFQATLAMHTGSFFVARPSIGSWVSYGLGTMNRNLPSFVVLAPHLPGFLRRYPRIEAGSFTFRRRTCQNAHSLITSIGSGVHSSIGRTIRYY